MTAQSSLEIAADVAAAAPTDNGTGMPGDATAASHRCRGLLRLRFSRTPASGATTLAIDAQRPPLRVIRAFPLADGAALVHLHNVSGGVLGGDHLEMQVAVEAGAHAQITSTSATRLYRSSPNAPTAVQRITCRVADGALLEYLPDALIPFAGARYAQDTSIELGAGAGLFWWEIVAPGRSASHERFAYDLLELRLDLTARGKPVAQDRVRLEPSLRPLSSPVRLGVYRYFATFYVCRVDVPAATWLALESELATVAASLSRPGEISWGVSTLPAHGLVVRALACNGQEITAGLFAMWAVAKGQLYGQMAIPPRKIY